MHQIVLSESSIPERTHPEAERKCEAVANYSRIFNGHHPSSPFTAPSRKAEPGAFEPLLGGSDDLALAPGWGMIPSTWLSSPRELSLAGRPIGSSTDPQAGTFRDSTLGEKRKPFFPPFPHLKSVTIVSVLRSTRFSRGLLLPPEIETDDAFFSPPLYDHGSCSVPRRTQVSRSLLVGDGRRALLDPTHGHRFVLALILHNCSAVASSIILKTRKNNSLAGSKKGISGRRSEEL